MRAGPWQRIIVNHAGNEEVRFGVLKAGFRSDQARIFSLPSRRDYELGLRAGVWVAVAPHRRTAARRLCHPVSVFPVKLGNAVWAFPLRLIGTLYAAWSERACEGGHTLLLATHAVPDRFCPRPVKQMRKVPDSRTRLCRFCLRWEMRYVPRQGLTGAVFFLAGGRHFCELGSHAQIRIAS